MQGGYMERESFAGYTIIYCEVHDIIKVGKQGWVRAGRGLFWRLKHWSPETNFADMVCDLCELEITDETEEHGALGQKILALLPARQKTECWENYRMLS